jgi:hypothetical protein
LVDISCGRIKKERTADSLQRIRLKLIKQGEKEGVFKDYLVPIKVGICLSPSDIGAVAPPAVIS